eukprot:TRINITY_DN14707_c0_g1_i1.p1 TRINITY_DN14707_c0_g1~~TRINITY_DN14707_c0_g1_i1.p1  ORF type:complete len:279 (-),score=33.19 TRINITY_DN14707_c0_g1_i1:173-1009(-)
MQLKHQRGSHAFMGQDMSHQQRLQGFDGKSKGHRRRQMKNTNIVLNQSLSGKISALREYMTKQRAFNQNQTKKASKKFSEREEKERSDKGKRNAPHIKSPPPGGSSSHSSHTPGGSSGGGGASANDVSSGSSVTSMGSVRCYVGVEYECHRGHRTVVTFTQSVKDHKGGKPSRSRRGAKHIRFIGASFPPRDIAMQVTCRRSDCNIASQMQRIFFVTPEAPICIVMDPVVQCLKPESTFRLGRRVILQPNSFLVLHLPYVYVRKGNFIQSKDDKFLER